MVGASVEAQPQYGRAPAVAWGRSRRGRERRTIGGAIEESSRGFRIGCLIHAAAPAMAWRIPASPGGARFGFTTRDRALTPPLIPAYFGWLAMKFFMAMYEAFLVLPSLCSMP